jgi:HK97 family phage portal protein
MGDIARVMASHQIVIPFTPSTYDSAFPAHWASHTVTPATVMSLPVAYACTRVVSEDIAKVPFQVFEDMGPDGKEVAKDHEWYDALHHQSNEFQTAIEFREMMTAWALNRGRGIAEKRKRRVRLRGGQFVEKREIVPLHPALVTAEVTDDGTRKIRYADPILKRDRFLLMDELLIIRGFEDVGVLQVARRSFELMLQMQGYAIESWKKGPRHTGVIMRPKDAPKWNDTNRGIFRDSVDEYQGGGDREGRPLLLEDGMTWANSSFTMQDAEFLGLMQHSVADGCRWYRVPQHKVQELGRSTNNNIEQQSIDYITDSIMSWAVRWEQASRRDLLTAPFFAEHNLDALLRADTKSRAEAHVLYVNAGIKTQDEIRKIENLNPMGGEAGELRQALNMTGNISGTSVAESEVPDRQADWQRDASVTARLRLFSRDAASRLVRKEVATLTKLAERTGGQGDDWRDGVEAFYREHSEFVARVLRLTPEAADTYCDDRKWRVLSMGSVAIDDPEESPVADLVELAVNQSLALVPTGAAA